jgi:hypothetical protein
MAVNLLDSCLIHLACGHGIVMKCGDEMGSIGCCGRDRSLDFASSLPTYELKSSRSPVINSVSNAKQILTTLAIYAEEHDGLLPPDLRTGCVDVGMVDPSDLLVSPLDPAHREYIFLCPGAKLADLPPGTHGDS